jgi:hypothetical protein
MNEERKNFKALQAERVELMLISIWETRLNCERFALAAQGSRLATFDERDGPCFAPSGQMIIPSE